VILECSGEYEQLTETMNNSNAIMIVMHKFKQNPAVENPCKKINRKNTLLMETRKRNIFWEA
jgi:nucleoside-triphosphatase THEP1